MVNRFDTAVVRLKIYIQSVLYVAVGHILPLIINKNEGLTFFGYSFIFHFVTVNILSLNRSSLSISDSYSIVGNIYGSIKGNGMITVVVENSVLRIQ